MNKQIKNMIFAYTIEWLIADTNFSDYLINLRIAKRMCNMIGNLYQFAEKETNYHFF
jgi:hypothetical protein